MSGNTAVQVTAGAELAPAARRRLLGYIVAVGASIAATVLSRVFGSFVAQMQFFLPLAAVLASSLVGGRGPGLLATALSIAGADLVLFQPRGSLFVMRDVDALRLVVFALMGALVSVLSDLLLKTRLRAAAREEALRQSERRYRMLFEQAPIGIYRARTDGTLLDGNGTLLAMLGAGSVDGLRVGGGDPVPDAPLSPAFLQALNGQMVTGAEESWQRADGSVLPVRHSVRVVEEADGTVVEGIVEDVTEWRTLEEQLRHAQKMDAVGRLAAGVAHDFNNALTAIRGYAALVLDHVQDARVREDVAEIDRAAETSAAVTQKLLAFSRRQVMRPEIVDPGPLLARLDGMLGRVLGEHVQLKMHIEPDLGAVRLDPGQFEQVVVNLAVNARDAMPGGGILRINLSREGAPAEASDDEGRWITLTVADTGVGMDPMTRVQAFEPFFSTKPRGRGTGLGLSTVYGIVRQNGGFIELDSEPGAGTAVRVFLPQTVFTPEASDP